MEIMDDVQMRVVNHAGATKRRWDEVPTMFFKYVPSWATVSNAIANLLLLQILRNNGWRMIVINISLSSTDSITGP